MSPAEKRARAAELRAEARRLVKEAETDEAVARLDAQRESLLAAAARHAETGRMCRPVWVAEPMAPGTRVVVRVQGPNIVVAQVTGSGTLTDERAYSMRDGRTLVAPGWRLETDASRGKLDVAATLQAWRDWCW